jgi:hypothetical protein
MKRILIINVITRVLETTRKIKQVERLSMSTFPLLHHGFFFLQLLIWNQHLL